MSPPGGINALVRRSHEERVLRALTQTTPRDETELVALSQSIDTIRREVTRVR